MDVCILDRYRDRLGLTGDTGVLLSRTGYLTRAVGGSCAIIDVETHIIVR